ncbi:MAG: shikimate dehydrogenase [Clostridia bacterium]|nr:shikimate dehydrogenase [Clostridia bacterium]
MKYGLIGEKLSYSFSAEIHERFFGTRYELCELAPAELKSFVALRGFAGINVTAPYKRAVVPLLDRLSGEARASGAVNVIINENGVLCGYNTDIYGMRAAFARSGCAFSGKKALVLGSGGTSGTALAALKEDFRPACALRVSRTGKDGCLTYLQALKEHSDAEIIINTTPCGTSPEIAGEAIDPARFPNLAFVFDAVYNPLNTRLCVKSRESGAQAEGGLYMLVAQAVKSESLFTGAQYGEDVTESIYKTLRSEKLNVVLTGMPGAGKSTVGELTARILSRPFYDTDSLITEKTGMTPGEIIKGQGEALFRKIESEVIAALADIQGAVIATGGGAVLDAGNVRALKANGRVYFIDRPPGDLSVSEERPLTPDRTALARVYAERRDVYLKNCDRHIKGGEDASETALMIAEEYRIGDFL